MKKILLIMLGVLMTLPAIARYFTYTYKGNTLFYTVLDEGLMTCETKVGNSLYEQPGNYVSGSLEIPAEVSDGINTYSVTSIGNSSFICNDLTSVEIPTSVTSIGEDAFNSCYRLTSINIPNSVTSIGIGAFYNCTRLTSINIPNSVTSISVDAFSGCNSLTSVEIPNSVTSIGRSAFSGCFSLTSINIPNSVTSIGEYAFNSCFSLTSINIPNSVTLIREYTFYYCTGLTSVEIPSSVIFIGVDAFKNCSSLTSVYYNTENPIGGDALSFRTCPLDEATLYVPEAAVEKCKEIEPWKNFGNIVAYDFSSNVEVIADFDQSAPIEVFDLNGVKVADNADNLPAGLYIIRQGQLTKKIAVK